LVSRYFRLSWASFFRLARLRFNSVIRITGIFHTSLG
jgi:hypothetical protein